MKSTGVLIWRSIVGMVMLLAAGASHLQAQQPPENAVRQADIIFTGEVILTGATSMKGVPDSDLIIELVVGEVLEKPATIALSSGDRVTVLTRDSSPFESGTKTTIYAQGWILGEHIAVREVAHVLIEDEETVLEAGEARPDLERIRAELADRDLRSRAQSADLIVVGKVVAVQIGTFEASPAYTRTTEHDPEWTEATIEIESSIKGSPDGETVIVRFPASKDVAWYKAPKFSVGQEGAFMLTRSQVTEGPGFVMEGADVDSFTALEQGHVLPKDQADRIRRLLER